jgi:hypothetical protein
MSFTIFVLHPTHSVLEERIAIVQIDADGILTNGWLRVSSTSGAFAAA